MRSHGPSQGHGQARVAGVAGEDARRGEQAPREHVVLTWDPAWVHGGLEKYLLRKRF